MHFGNARQFLNVHKENVKSLRFRVALDNDVATALIFTAALNGPTHLTLHLLNHSRVCQSYWVILI